MSWMILSAVAVGGAIGACTRYLVTMQMTAWLGYGFPYGTLSVNIVGGLIMGAWAVSAAMTMYFGIYFWRLAFWRDIPDHTAQTHAAPAQSELFKGDSHL